ncbi:MAG: type II toxin-antitoxin system Phd/YefM family antitoxin [Planctomycetaceae bacterium]
MARDRESSFEFEVGVTELRGSLGFTVRQVARSGEPVIVRRYRRAEVILVPLREWRRLRRLEADLETTDPCSFPMPIDDTPDHA